MRVLIDCDVLLDVALAREPFLDDSAEILRWAEAGGDAAVAWHSLSNCAYLLKGGGRGFLERLLRIVEVAPVATADAKRALDLPMTDVEDAFQAAAALAWKAEHHSDTKSRRLQKITRQSDPPHRLDGSPQFRSLMSRAERRFSFPLCALAFLCSFATISPFFFLIAGHGNKKPKIIS